MIEIEAPGDGVGGHVEVGGQSVLPDVLPVLPLRDSVTYPDTLTPLAVGQRRSIELVTDVLGGDRMLVMVASRDTEADEPGPDQLYEVGVAGVVARMLKVPDGSLRILVQGAQRVRITGWERVLPYPVARVAELPDVVREGPELTALVRNVQGTFSNIIEAVPYLPEELQLAVANIDDPAALAHLIAGALRIRTEDKQALLEELDVAKRLRRLSEILAHELEVVAIGSRIQSQVQSEIDSSQREFLLRQQLKAIQEELGERDPAQAELTDLRGQLETRELPDAVRKQADRELSRLEQLPQAAAEHGVIRSYLEWIAALPWDSSTEDDLDLAHAREVLDADHYDIEQVKERILEFLAVGKLRGGLGGGSILCLLGPPGVGKTSLGRSIARAVGRRFERISVGGMRDEAEIRGHRRTYIGAMPGVILRALRDAESNNPLLMIDEIDKMGADFRGDPSSAMLEVLDPEQNAGFRDHYLDLPFDLSRVMFVTTANTLDTVPVPLQDRMEVIRLSGYTEQEKLEIARRYLAPRQIARAGLKRSQIAFTDTGLRTIISDHTREAGVRNLEREIGAACRKVARRVADGDKSRVSVTEPRVRELLGRPKVSHEVNRRTREPGVATGLAWTPVGGDVLFVEATAMPTRSQPPELTLTGHLGDVMRESAQAALSWVRGNTAGFAPELADDWFARHDVHVHVPSGAIPKDGPSAGITIATALVSLLTGRPVRADVAMTGEITLTGQVLPIGGLKEKALAAQRSGIRRIIAPARNEAELEDMPQPLRSRIEFVWVSEIGAVLEHALETRRRRRASI